MAELEKANKRLAALNKTQDPEEVKRMQDELIAKHDNQIAQCKAAVEEVQAQLANIKTLDPNLTEDASRAEREAAIDEFRATLDREAAVDECLQEDLDSVDGYKVHNMSDSAADKEYIVARLVDDEYWYYAAFDDEAKAIKCASELNNVKVLYRSGYNASHNVQNEAFEDDMTDEELAEKLDAAIKEKHAK